jgi:type I restriction enzyme S subunit
MRFDREYTVQQLIEEDILFPIDDGNHGSIHPKVSDYVSEGIPFLMASDLLNSRADLRGCAFLSSDQVEVLRKGFARNGDVLLTHKGTVGRTAILKGCDDKGAILSPQVTYYRVKDHSKLNPDYLRWYFDSNQFQLLFATWAGAGSTRAYLGITAQRDLPVFLPSIEAQNAIAHILGTLDDKIELNRKTNETLEAMAKALFKSWFVDFDPVRAKAEGRPTGLPSEIGDLFPDSFEDSELGEIPRG